jgi:hypothetical protein
MPSMPPRWTMMKGGPTGAVGSTEHRHPGVPDVLAKSDVRATAPGGGTAAASATTLLRNAAACVGMPGEPGWSPAALGLTAPQCSARLALLHSGSEAWTRIVVDRQARAMSKIDASDSIILPTRRCSLQVTIFAAVLPDMIKGKSLPLSTSINQLTTCSIPDRLACDLVHSLE